MNTMVIKYIENNHFIYFLVINSFNEEIFGMRNKGGKIMIVYVNVPLMFR
jgi:hypothetical protein